MNNPNQESIQTKYAQIRYKPSDDRKINKAEEIRIKKIIKASGTNNTILDVGCYDGFIGEKLIKAGNIVYGMEISKEAVLVAQKKGLIVSYTSAEDNFPYKDNFFDVVIAGEIIEHLLDTKKFLKEIKRVLKTDGKFILTTPNVASLGRRIFLLFGKNPYFEAAYGYPPEADAGHIRFYTKKVLLNFLNYMSFNVIKYESTVINFNKSGNFSSKALAKLFPTLGACHFVIAKKIQNFK